MKRLAFLFIALLCVTTTFAYTERNLLTKQVDMAQLKNMLVLNQQWVTYPDYTDRKGWDDFLGAFKDEYIRRGEKMLDYEWQLLKATDYLTYERTGNLVVMKTPYEANITAITTLLMAELAEGKGRFVDQLINGVFYACEMTSWALVSHLITQPSTRALPSYDYPLLDLGSTSVGEVLSWTYYFLHKSFDKVDPEISRRLRHEIQVRILDPYLDNDSFWWMGRNYKGRMLNNWTPYCNSHVLQCFMLLEENPDILAKAVYLSMDSVDKFLNYIKSDGACEEGPSYWGIAAGKVLDYLELLSTITGGKIDIFQEPLIKDMGEYVSRSYVGNDWVVNFADAPARGGGDAYLIYRFAKRVKSDELEGFAALRRKESKLPLEGRDVYRTLASIDVAKELQQAVPCHETNDFTWYPETEFCYLTTQKGLFLATKGGHNGESHNHNDVGSCIVYFDQMPMLIDAGVGTYTRQTFSSKRYDIWTMQSDYHNLPMINGVSQKDGKKYKATEVKAAKNQFSANIATAYPKEAKVKTWVRSYKTKGSQVQIKDAFELEEIIAPNTINFMTWGEIDTSKKGEVSIQVNGVKALLLYDAHKFELSVETKELTDPKLTRVWGNAISRLSFKAKQKAVKGNYTFTIKK